MIFKVIFNPNHSMIPYVSIFMVALEISRYKPAVVLQILNPFDRQEVNATACGATDSKYYFSCSTV